MTALAANRKATDQLGYHALPEVVSYPVAASVHVYAGALAVLRAGYLRPGSATAGDIVVGRADKEADNSSGSAGAISCPVRRGVMRWVNGDSIAQADVGKACYVVDDQTVAKSSSSGTRPFAGIIVAVSSEGVFVLCGEGMTDPATALPTIQTGTVTLSGGTFAVTTGVTITASSKVYVSRNTLGGTAGHLRVADASLVVGGSGTGAFTIDSSSGTETSTVNYLIVG